MRLSFALRLWITAALTLNMAWPVLGGSSALASQDGFLLLSVASQPKSNIKIVQARMEIDAPPEQVWRVITDYPDLKNILPGYEKSVLVPGGHGKLLDIAMKVAAFLPTYRYRVYVQESVPDYRITLNRVSGDFRALNATYKLIPQNGGRRTLLSYNLSIDTGSSVPGSQAVIRSHTERSMKALERHIEQEARRSEIGQR